MKEELETKYVPSSFSTRFMDNWYQHTQYNKPAKEYVEKFDEFLIRCNTPLKESEAQFFLDSEPALEMIYELKCCS